MHHDIDQLRRFYYQRALGRVVQRILRDRLCMFWPPGGVTGMTVAGFGFAAPLLRPHPSVEISPLRDAADFRRMVMAH